MAYPFLPVNPCCTDVVINDPCGCSSVITNSGCNGNSPCSTNLTASSTIVYNGPLLTCTTAEPCDTLNVILQKIDSIICNLLTQINTLNIQVNNITTQIITINGDIININNQLDNCCNATTTSTSTTIYVAPCESFLLTNIGAVPLAIIVTDCITGMQEPIVLLPGDTNICVETDSPLVFPGTVIATPTGPCPSTTTTTTTICEGFSLFNPSVAAIDVIVTPCNTGIEEILSVDPGTTYVCLLGGASFTIDDPIILTPEGPCPTTTTTTTLFIPCECITFTNTDTRGHSFSYIDCSNETIELVSIASGEIVSVCGCCGGATNPLVTISIGANCIQGICPPTTSTTTTEPPVICLFTGIANQIPNPITTTTTSSTTIATVPILNTGGTGYQASGTTCDAINYPYSLEFSLPTPNNFATMFTPDKLWSDIEYVEIVSTSTTAGLEIQYDGITVAPGLQLIPTSVSDWQYPLIITRSSFDCTNLDEVWEVTIKLYEFTELTNTALFFTSFSQSNCPECTTTTTTTKLPCSYFELQGLTGGGSWTGLDCYTELPVGDSILQGLSEFTGCIISSSLEVTNLTIKGESPCLTTTTTTTLLSDCYIVEGIWEVDDPAHPAGGYVDYIDEFGNNQSLSGLWVIDSINIIASSIITSSGVTVTPSDCSTTTTTTTLAPTTTTTTTASVCTIPIDTQLWGCANLDVTEYANGDPIPEVTDQATWAALTTGAWCYYNNDPLNGAIYGKLYNWYAVNDPRGLVPAGYHIPTNTDWINLATFLGGDLVAGGPLKEAGTVHWTSPNVGATNSSGFTGLPGGFRDTAGAFQLINDVSYWWTSTAIDPSSSYIYGLDYSNAATSPTSGTGGFLQDGYSVRLLQD